MKVLAKQKQRRQRARRVKIAETARIIEAGIAAAKSLPLPPPQRMVTQTTNRRKHKTKKCAKKPTLPQGTATAVVPPP